MEELITMYNDCISGATTLFASLALVSMIILIAWVADMFNHFKKK